MGQEAAGAELLADTEATRAAPGGAAGRSEAAQRAGLQAGGQASSTGEGEKGNGCAVCAVAAAQRSGAAAVAAVPAGGGAFRGGRDRSFCACRAQHSSGGGRGGSEGRVGEAAVLRVLLATCSVWC